MEKLNKTPTVVLGAINGLLFGVLLEIVLRLIFLYGRYLISQEPKGDLTICYSDYWFSWYFLPILLLFSAIFATFSVQHFVVSRIKSQVWLWQIIGIFTALFAFLFSKFYAYAYTSYFWGFEFLEDELSGVYIKDDLFILLIFIPIAAAFNLLFTLALKSLKPNLS